MCVDYNIREGGGREMGYSMHQKKKKEKRTYPVLMNAVSNNNNNNKTNSSYWLNGFFSQRVGLNVPLMPLSTFHRVPAT